MITVQIKGGLGNQLFQYAAAKSLAMHLRTSFQLDLTEFDKQGSRSFDLDYFNAPYKVATPEEVKALEIKGLFPKILQRLRPAYRRKKYWEPHFHFDPHFFDASPDVYLKGNRQSEKYFLPIASVIRNDFTLKKMPDKPILQKADIMQAENSISVHIRRGDYLKPEYLKYHGILSNDYYNEAIRQLEGRIDPIKIYFFSDDIEWVKTNIHLNHPYEFISGTLTHTAIEDFYLMQHCRHNIIANSSFSWWAAWLNKNPGKTVIAPKKWFNEAKLNTKDILPSNWISI